MAKRGTFSHIIPENRGKCNVRAGESPKNQPAPSYPVKNLRPSEVRCYLRSHSKLVVLAFHPVTKQTRTWEVKCMSCLENPRDRGAWWAVICGVAQSRTRLKQLSSSSSWYFYQENSMDRGAWGATEHGVAKSQTQLSD